MKASLYSDGPLETAFTGITVCGGSTSINEGAIPNQLNKEDFWKLFMKSTREGQYWFLLYIRRSQITPSDLHPSCSLHVRGDSFCLHHVPLKHIVSDHHISSRRSPSINVLFPQSVGHVAVLSNEIDWVVVVISFQDCVMTWLVVQDVPQIATSTSTPFCFGTISGVTCP